MPSPRICLRNAAVAWTDQNQPGDTIYRRLLMETGRVLDGGTSH